MPELSIKLVALCAREKPLRLYSRKATSLMRVTYVIGGNIAERAIVVISGLSAERAAAKLTKANANTSVDEYSPANCALPKNEARKCDETTIDIAAKMVQKRSNMSEVLVNKSCV